LLQFGGGGGRMCLRLKKTAVNPGDGRDGNREHMKNNRISFDIRRKIISSATGSGWKAPHAVYVYEADATELLEEFDALNNSVADDKKIALNTVIMKIVVEGIKVDPRLNAHISFNPWLCSGHIKIINNIDVNTPVLLPTEEMITVKIPDCGIKSLSEMENHIKKLMYKLNNTNADITLLDVGLEDTFKQIRRGDFFHPLGRILGLKFGKDRLKRFSKKDKNGHKKAADDIHLSNDDMNMGTVTISNLGAAARDTIGAPVLIDLISPQVLAVGIGAIQDKPIIFNSEIVSRKIIPFCIVFDHRALDFGIISKLIKQIDFFFKRPQTIHNWRDAPGNGAAIFLNTPREFASPP
jgi:pyruvate dehydrogenase E2 component (dihydrolipoamide acetyltransferase)